MIVSTQLLPVRIDTPATITSAGRSSIETYYTKLMVDVGNTFTLTEPIYKLIVVESIGPILIYRYYLTSETRLQNHYFIPLYCTMYTSDETTTLIYKNGIAEIMNIFGDGSCDNTSLYSDVLSSVMLSSFIEEGDTDSYDSSAAYRAQYRPYNDVLHNNSVVLHSSDSYLLGEYPWGSYNVGDTILYDRQTAMAESLVSHIYIHTRAPVNTFSWDIMDYYLPPPYEVIALDRLTTEDTLNPIMKSKRILDRSRFVNRRINNSVTHHGKVNIFEYSSKLMSLCDYVQQSPFIELSVKYILLTRDVKYTRRVCLDNTKVLEHTFKFNEGLLHLLRTWDRIDELSISKIDDVMYLDIVIGATVSKYVIDLTLTTMLSTSIVRM